LLYCNLVTIHTISIMASTSNPYNLKIDARALKNGVLAVTSTFEASTLKEEGSTLELLHIANEARKYIHENWEPLLDEVDEKIKDDYGYHRLTEAPYILTALLAGGNLYLCSSVRTNTSHGENFISKLQGSNISIQAEPTITKMLRNALLLGHHKRNLGSLSDLHANQANCGEILAVYQWLTFNSGRPLTDLWNCPMVSTAVVGNGARTMYIVKEPCGPTQRGEAIKNGCNKIVPFIGTLEVATQDGATDFKRDQVPNFLSRISLGNHFHIPIVP